jgi:hypothetical protein
MKSTINKIVICLLEICLFASVAKADFIWPPAIYYGGVLTWWVVLVGLLVEYPFYFYGFRLGWKK